MPLMADRIKVGCCYGMIIGGKLIVAKVIQIYPLEIGVSSTPEGLRDRKLPVTENIVRWAWRDVLVLGNGRSRRDGCCPPSLLRRKPKSPATIAILTARKRLRTIRSPDGNDQ